MHSKSLEKNLETIQKTLEKSGQLLKNLDPPPPKACFDYPKQSVLKVSATIVPNERK